MKPIERISITDSVVESIKELIISGEYQVDDKLPAEQKLCEELGVSRTSVREALRVLQALGYVKMLPGKGAFVARNTLINDAEKDWFEDGDSGYLEFMEVRLALEPVAVRLAIENGTEAQVKELEDIEQSFREAVEKRNSVKMMLADDLFHKHIFLMGKNKMMCRINDQISKVYLKYRKQSFTDDTIYKNAIKPHDKIVECIKQGNIDGAVEEMRKHMEMARIDMDHMHSGKNM